MAKKQLSTMGQRLADCLRLLRAGDISLFEHLMKICEPMASITIDESDGGKIVVARRQHGATVGIDTNSDVTALCAQTFMALFGPLWCGVQACHEAWGFIHDEARAEARVRKNNKKSKENAEGVAHGA